MSVDIKVILFDEKIEKGILKLATRLYIIYTSVFPVLKIMVISNDNDY